VIDPNTRHEVRTKQVDVRKSGFKARFKGFLTNPSTASLYVLSYVPWSVRRLGYRQDMYSYV
jgi:hypothetical protein